MPIKIYGFPRSRATRATWAAEEAGIEYRFIKVDLASGEHRRAPFTDLNPGGKVPVLVVGDQILSESAAIVTAIGDLAPGTELVPHPGSRERARYDQWLFFTIGELEQPLWTMVKHAYALPKEYRVRDLRKTAAWEFARAVAALSVGLGDREYLLGDRFTFADLMVAHTLGWALRQKQEIAPENLKGYAQRVLARPALARARSREDEGAAQGG